MRQNRLESLLEKFVDTTTAFIISWCVYEYYIYPNMHSMSSFFVVSIFTAISFLRGYFWRRFFNQQLHKTVHNLLRGFTK